MKKENEIEEVKEIRYEDVESILSKEIKDVLQSDKIEDVVVEIRVKYK